MIDINKLTLEQLTLLEEQLKQKMNLPLCPCCKRRCGNYFMPTRQPKSLRAILLEIMKSLPKRKEFSTFSLQEAVIERGMFLTGNLRNRISSEVTKFKRAGVVECLSNLRGSHTRLYRYLHVK